MKRTAVLGCLVMALGVAGCRDTPTSLDWNLSVPVQTIFVSGTLSNPDGAATIQRVTLLLDGSPFGAITPGEPAVQVSLAGSRTGDRGHHTLEIRIDSQTTSPNTYRTSSISVVLTNSSVPGSGTVYASASLPGQSRSLATGEGITYEFGI